jgi:hypothetical protein
MVVNSIFEVSGHKAADDAVAAIERRLAAARQIRSLMVEFPDLIAEMTGAAFARSNEECKVPVERKGNLDDGSGLSNYQRIAKFFVMNGNGWFEAPRVGEALGLTRGTVATVFWTSHADKFQKEPIPGTARKKVWRLKPDILNQVRQELELLNGTEAK